MNYLDVSPLYPILASDSTGSRNGEGFFRQQAASTIGFLRIGFYAALLWLEFVGSPEGQKILNENGPYEASVFIAGTVQERAARGKKQSVVDWAHYNKIPEYERKIIEAYGFPRAE